METARKTGLLARHGIALDSLHLPVDWQDQVFVPYDWGYFAFVYDTQQLPEPPTSLEQLINAPDDLKIIIQDPRHQHARAGPAVVDAVRLWRPGR